MRVNWVSEIQNDWGRRAALAATCPVFIAWNLVVAVINAAICAAFTLIFGIPRRAFRSTRMVLRAFRLRWYWAKPRGELDWVSYLIDQERR